MNLLSILCAEIDPTSEEIYSRVAERAAAQCCRPHPSDVYCP
jgi:hypothetical protein